MWSKQRKNSYQDLENAEKTDTYDPKELKKHSANLPDLKLLTSFSHAQSNHSDGQMKYSAKKILRRISKYNIQLIVNNEA